MKVELKDVDTAELEHFLQDMESLNVAPADVFPRATDEIPTMLELTRGLVDKGHAYESGGSVYFRVRSVSDYGKLSHRTVESMLADLTAARAARGHAAEPGEHPDVARATDHGGDRQRAERGERRRRVDDVDRGGHGQAPERARGRF